GRTEADQGSAGQVRAGFLHLRRYRRRFARRARGAGFARERGARFGQQEGRGFVHPAGPAEDHRRQRAGQAASQGHQPVHQGRAVVRRQARLGEGQGAPAEEAEGRRVLSCRTRRCGSPLRSERLESPWIPAFFVFATFTRAASWWAGMTTRPLLPLIVVVALSFVLALPGCKRESATAGPAGKADDGATLPRPDADPGSVTGMPDEPGPGAIGAPPAADAATMDDPEIVFDEDAADTASAEVVPGEPSAADAVAVLRDYYAAIAARDYARAHALWSDGGRASGQTLEQFAAGFATTASVVAETGQPGRVEPAAGSRYIEVPVSISATRDDGSVHRYLGNYTLRRAVVDGASAEQRAWRIATADIREVTVRSGS